MAKTNRPQPGRSSASSAKSKKAAAPVWNFPLEKKDLVIIGLGIASILIGYALMATGITEQPAVPDGKWNNSFAVIIGPIFLLLGYCVIIPLGIMKFFTKRRKAAAPMAAENI